MKYMLMMNTPRGGDYAIARWPKPAIQAHMAFMMDFANKLNAAGELAAAEGLAAPSEAKLVRAGKDGTPVTDGIFPESKEFLAGYWIVDVASPERAYELAAAISVAPGPDGAPLYLSVEVRQVMSPPTDAIR